ncbi:unnamed protein product [Protopolystoma xenopodis]|uniref:Uncharacterized protein n=1 Tax=Protopolystoma xenopodis TaxID=117903 RepID=A0A3S5AQM5_9PLAT|nr:unnamed protein product [Protopolystoma xenopodis]
MANHRLGIRDSNWIEKAGTGASWLTVGLLHHRRGACSKGVTMTLRGLRLELVFQTPRRANNASISSSFVSIPRDASQNLSSYNSINLIPVSTSICAEPPSAENTSPFSSSHETSADLHPLADPNEGSSTGDGPLTTGDEEEASKPLLFRRNTFTLSRPDLIVSSSGDFETVDAESVIPSHEQPSRLVERLLRLKSAEPIDTKEECSDLIFRQVSLCATR